MRFVIPIRVRRAFIRNLLQPLFALPHLISGKIFWFTSSYFPEQHRFRVLIEKSLLRFYKWESELIPGASDAYSKIASLLANQGDPVQAINFYNRALEHHHPDAAKIHYFIIRQRVRQKDMAEAMHSIQKFIQLCSAADNIDRENLHTRKSLNQDPEFDPGQFYGYYYMGKKYLQRGYKELAIKYFRHSIQLDPLYSLAHIELIEALYGNTRPREFFRMYRAAHYYQLRHTHPGLRLKSGPGNRIQKPDFMIIGRQKCGTTSLHDYMKHHPCILPSLGKESHFFDRHYERGLDWYLAQFPPIRKHPELITGEATASYMDSQLPAERIRKHCPNAKLIVLLRNPAQRAISQFYMAHWLGLEKGEIESSFMSWLDTRVQDRKENLYMEQSIYITMMRVWMEVLSADQFLVLRSEDLFNDPAKTTNRVYEFLGQSPFIGNNYKVANKGIYTPANPSLQHRLNEYFRPYNQELEDYLGMKFDWDT